MMNYDLAIDEDGEPFAVPPQVAGWRVRRAAEGRGRPLLVHARGPEKGKPLVLRAGASHADLLAAAGPGRYRLEAVDEHWHKIDGVPVACTGPLSADEDPSASDGESGIEMFGGAPVRPVSYENVLCHMVTAQTKIMEKTLGQLGVVMSSVAELLNAAHNAGITSRPPPPPPPPPPVAEVEELEADDEIDESEDAERATNDEAPSKLSEVTRLIIKETIDRAVPLIFEKLTANGVTNIGGIPVEALADWRKAAPGYTSAQRPPAAHAASSAYATPSPPAAPFAPSSPTVATAVAPAPMTAPSSAVGAIETPLPATTRPPAVANVVAGAAPTQESPLGAAPAEMAKAPAAGSPRTPEEAASLLSSHLLQVWQGLSPPERARAGQLVSRLASEERTAWLSELARLTVPEAIARARAVIHGPPASTPPTAQVPSATTPQGETS